MMLLLKEQYNRVPENPLYSYAYHKYHTGDYYDPLELLVSNKYWPAARLPSSIDYCDSWLVQRDPGKDWQPCDEGKTHTGGELIFIVSLIERDLKL
jgi:hypothetical protein